ncbi:hypothetical protein GTPT_1756 [Tatumella ptyseos ATCC 33301]|uniref:Uncharacterized protein n=1 Tax=Tatumella ptyseos ATCC 33301 TaxID=1005995 RepID=A0A085JH77_9GAMM|nr:hypothetical protein GTPT_1756 [Tatumella ptyseos ATCC 33301]
MMLITRQASNDRPWQPAKQVMAWKMSVRILQGSCQKKRVSGQSPAREVG